MSSFSEAFYEAQYELEQEKSKQTGSMLLNNAECCEYVNKLQRSLDEPCSPCEGDRAVQAHSENKGAEPCGVLGEEVEKAGGFLVVKSEALMSRLQEGAGDKAGGAPARGARCVVCGGETDKFVAAVRHNECVACFEARLRALSPLPPLSSRGLLCALTERVEKLEKGVAALELALEERDA